MISEDIYSQIVRLMPIPCVDIVVVDDRGRVLLMKRANEPASGQWWFPGGRIHYLETRLQAAARKLKEECNLAASEVIELGTYDVIVNSPGAENPMHGITTLFCVRITSRNNLKLDFQSSEADWRVPEEWQKLPMHPFVQEGLAAFMRYRRQDGKM